MLFSSGTSASAGRTSPSASSTSIASSGSSTKTSFSKGSRDGSSVQTYATENTLEGSGPSSDDDDNDGGFDLPSADPEGPEARVKLAAASRTLGVRGTARRGGGGTPAAAEMRLATAGRLWTWPQWSRLGHRGLQRAPRQGRLIMRLLRRRGLAQVQRRRRRLTAPRWRWPGHKLIRIADYDWFLVYKIGMPTM